MGVCVTRHGKLVSEVERRSSRSGLVQIVPCVSFNCIVYAEIWGVNCIISYSVGHCPSGDDPRTTSTDETDCYNVTAAGSSNRGESGNICHVSVPLFKSLLYAVVMIALKLQVDCANRGLCNYKTGLCSCFDGYIGENCATINTLSFHRANVPEPEF